MTNSSRDSLAVEVAQQVFDHIKAQTNNDPRIRYELQCYYDSDGQVLSHILLSKGANCYRFLVVVLRSCHL